MKNKLTLLLLAGVVLIVAVVLQIQKNQKENASDKAFEFHGNVWQVSDNRIEVQGSFKIEGKDFNSSDPIKTVMVEVGPETKIIRNAFKMPSAEELKATNGMFKPNELPKEERPSTVEELRQDHLTKTIGIKIISKKDILNKESFIASEIIYTLPN
ncbi:MAG TPA: hypothetical protein VD998_02105 [Verrucomicrobiae bacterium]|nr:hypothetical protein [Verrucomicrobiae bacterium]